MAPQTGLVVLAAYVFLWFIATLGAYTIGPAFLYNNNAGHATLILGAIFGWALWDSLVKGSKLTPKRWWQESQMPMAVKMDLKSMTASAPTLPLTAEQKKSQAGQQCASGCCGCAFGLFCLFFGIGLLAPKSDPQTVGGAPASSSVVVSGDEAVIVDGPGAFLCANEEASRALHRLKPGDSAGLMRLMSSGEVDLLPAGTLVRVTASHFTVKEVIVLTGGAACKRGTVPVEFVKAKP